MRISTRLRAGVALLPITVLGLVACVPTPPVPPTTTTTTTVPTPPAVLSVGHVDIGLAVENGEFEPHVHDEENDAEYAPDEAILTALPGTATTVPSDSAYSFLGAPGATTYVLPQTQDPALLWLGIGAEEIEAGVLVDDQFDMSITAVDGPGTFAMYTVDGLGVPTVLVDSTDGLPDTLAGLASGIHTHVNYAFSEPGTYEVSLRFTGTLADGNVALDSGPVTYTFDVQAAP
jgi:surface-anchored protein